MVNCIVYIVAVFLTCFNDVFVVGDEVPYISPMILGRTFDKSKSQVGVDIFSTSNRQADTCTNIGRTLIWYKHVTSQEDKRNLLDISGQLSLQVKAGLVKVDGKGSYLKEENSGKKFKEIIVRIERRTVKKELQGTPEPNFYENRKIVGEHYFAAMQYGGLLVASLKLVIENEKDTENIQAAIDANIGGGQSAAAFDLSVSGKFEKLESSTEDKANIEISYYATVPLTIIPTDITSFMELVNSFGDSVSGSDENKAAAVGNEGEDLCSQQNENKIGVPMTAMLREIDELTDESNNQFSYRESRLSGATVDSFQERFDDLQEAKTMIKDHLDEANYVSQPDEDKLGNLYDNIFRLQKRFKETVADLNLNLNKLGGVNPEVTLEAAIEEYNVAVNNDSLAGKFKIEAESILNTIRQNDESASESAEVRYGRLHQLVVDKKNTMALQLNEIQTTAEKFCELTNSYTAKVVNSFSQYFVYGTGNIKIPNPSPPQNMIFKQQIINEGSMYDEGTGEMTCPQNGYYLTISMRHGTNITLGGNAEDDGCDTVRTAVKEAKVELKKADDKITVNSLTADGVVSNTFQGLFISSD